MNRTTELHPIEVLILAVLLTAEALLTLVVAGVALVGALLPQPPRPAPAPAAPQAPPPAVHPLAAVAEAAEAAMAGSTVAELRRRARALGLGRQLSRAGRRCDLLAALAAVEVAACG